MKHHQHQDYEYQKKHVHHAHHVLHFDINETILIGDEAGGDTVEHSLNKILAKSALVQYSLSSSENEHRRHYIPTHWWDSTPLNKNDKNDSSDSSAAAPSLFTGWTWPDHTCPYYLTAYKNRSHLFTEPNQHGCIYRHLYHQMIGNLNLQERRNEDIKDDGDQKQNKEGSTVVESTLTPYPSSDSYKSPFQFILPAFFHTLHYLHKHTTSSSSSSTPSTTLKYTLVLRTMGSDLESVMNAIQLFAQGQHPQYPDYINPTFVFDENKTPLFRGRWRRKQQQQTYRKQDDRIIHNEIKDNNDNNCNNHDHHHYNKNDNISIMNFYTYQLFAWEDILCQNHPIANGDEEVLKFIESHSILGIQDDYEFWNYHQKKPWAGKPIWMIEEEEEEVRKKEIDFNYNNTGSAKTTSITTSAVDSSSSNSSSSSSSTWEITDTKKTFHHIFFDDNIHNDSEESIVAIRYKQSFSSTTTTTPNSIIDYQSLSGKEIVQQHGKIIFKVPTVQVILNKHWFIDQIEKFIHSRHQQKLIIC